MKNKHITIGDLVKFGGLSRQAVYKQIRAGKLPFRDGRGDPVKLLTSWRKAADPTRDDKIGPALERIIQERGLAPQEGPGMASKRARSTLRFPRMRQKPPGMAYLGTSRPRRGNSGDRSHPNSTSRPMLC
jgi:hypothetical protein